MPTIKNLQTGFAYLDDKPGQYVCIRSFEIGSQAYETAFECRNPVYGVLKLDEWQEIIEKRHRIRGAKAA